MRKAPKVKASLIRKYHIISFPYSTLNGLLPPFHHLVCSAVVVEDMLVTYTLTCQIFLYSRRQQFLSPPVATLRSSFYSLLNTASQLPRAKRRVALLYVLFAIRQCCCLFVTLSKEKGYPALSKTK